MNYKLRPDQNGSRPPTFINMDVKIVTITEYRQTDIGFCFNRIKIFDENGLPQVSRE